MSQITRIPEGRPVERVTRRAYRTVSHDARQIVVEMTPDDYLVFSEMGRRRRFRVSIRQAMLWAAWCEERRAAAANPQTDLL